MSAGLPAELVHFLASDGSGKYLLYRNHPVALWSAGNLERLNHSYQTGLYAPGLILIGSDYRDSALAIALSGDDFEMGEVPFVGMSRKKFRRRAGSWQAFLSLLKPASTALSVDDHYLVYRRPALFGGNRNPDSLVRMTEQEHIDYVVHWNRIVMQLRR